MEIVKNLVKGKVKVTKLGISFTGETSDGEVVNFSILHKPELATVGINNICEDGNFVLFLDYDNIEFDYFIKDLEKLSKNYGLSHFIVIKTRDKSYHAVCLEKFPLSKVQEIVNDSLCDYSYKRFPVKIDKGWILRVTDKIVVQNGEISSVAPVYMALLKFGKPRKFSISRAHLEFFAKIYPEFGKDALNYFDRESLDDFVRVHLIRYGTSKVTMSFGAPFLFSKGLNVSWVEARDDVNLGGIA